MEHTEILSKGRYKVGDSGKTIGKDICNSPIGRDNCNTPIKCTGFKTARLFKAKTRKIRG